MSIAGDPSGVEEAARVLAAAGQDFTDAADSVASHARALHSAWSGAAADAAFDAITALANRTRIGADVCAGTDPVLTAYAATLRAAQREYEAGAAAAGAATSAQHAAATAAASAQALDAADPTRQGAIEAAARGTAEAGVQVRAAHAVMADAVAAQRANAEAAKGIDALTARLDAMDATPSAQARCTGTSPLDRPHHGLFHDVLGAVGDALWSAGPGALGDLEGLSPLPGDQQVSREIQAAHDGLVHWYGADTSSETYRDVYLGGQVLTWFIPYSDAAKGAAAGGRAAEGAEILAADAAAGRGASLAEAGKTAYDVASLNQAVPQQYCGRPIVTETSGAKGRGWNQALRNPQPDTTYVVDDRQVYVTDDQGRVVHVEADLQHVDAAAAGARRHKGDQTTAGGPDRRTGDEGGHLVASSLGGPGEAINLVPMPRSLNGPGKDNWWAMERGLDADLQAHPGTEIRFDVDVDYPAGSRRPEEYHAMYTVDGQLPESKDFRQ